MAVYDGALQRGRLKHILEHMGRAQAGAAGLGVKLGLDVDAWTRRQWFGIERGDGARTLLEQDALEQRVFVPQHQTLVGGGAVGGLEIVEVRLVDTDSLLELLDVLGATLAERGLSLAVPLLAFLRGGVDL